MESVVKYLLLPFSLLWAAVLRFRHTLYDLGILKSQSFDFPVIGIGNLNLGGAGKTPFTEYVTGLLAADFRPGILSRGYRRRTKGFVLARPESGPRELGDEPYQMYRKWGDKVLLAVDADRRRGIARLRHYGAGAVILDDAFQHRQVEPGFRILLTPFHRPFYRDFLWPAGRLRDLRSRARAADVIVVTKTPAHATGEQKQRILENLKKYRKPVFFSGVRYLTPRNAAGQTRDWAEWQKSPFLLVTGIADPEPLLRFLKSQNLSFRHLAFPDHCAYNAKHLKTIRSRMGPENSGISVLTTEKDFVKLQERLPHLYFVPIRFSLDHPETFKALMYEQIKSQKPV